MYNIIDKRGEENAKTDRYLRELAKNIIDLSFITNYDQKKIGEFIKRHGHNFDGIEQLKSEHFNNYFDAKKNI